MSEEIWKDIPGFPNYQASIFGQIRNKDTLKLLKPYIGSRGYYTINIYDMNFKHYNKPIHKLIALTFISNPNNYPCINHKDENKYNNCVENLEWCTWKYNANYGKHNKKISKSLTGRILPKEVVEKMKKHLPVEIIREKVRNINLGITPTAKGKYRLNKGNRCIYVYPSEIPYYESLGYIKPERNKQ